MVDITTTIKKVRRNWKVLDIVCNTMMGCSYTTMYSCSSSKSLQGSEIQTRMEAEENNIFRGEGSLICNLFPHLLLVRTLKVLGISNERRLLKGPSGLLLVVLLVVHSIWPTPLPTLTRTYFGWSLICLRILEWKVRDLKFKKAEPLNPCVASGFHGINFSEMSLGTIYTPLLADPLDKIALHFQ